MGGGGQNFPRERRILNREDFLVVSRRGSGRHGEHFKVIFLKRGDRPTRLGLTVSRKVGGAVQRNRIKRMVREFFRRNLPNFPAKTDISVVAKRGAADLDYKAVCAELSTLFGNTNTAKIWLKQQSSH